MPTDLLELGRQVATDPTCHDMLIGDPPRPLTNVEMHAYSTWLHQQTYERIERDGCCGGGMDEYGRCPNTGRRCRLYVAAKRIEGQIFHQEQRV